MSDKPGVGLEDITAKFAMNPTDDLYGLRKKRKEWWNIRIRGIVCR
jgi:hypothetical protein